MNQNLNDAETLLDVGKLLVSLKLLDNDNIIWVEEVAEVCQNLRYRSEDEAYRAQN